MATRKLLRKERLRYTCGDCAHSYDRHEKNWRGELFMCRCPYYKDGKFSKFLNDLQCEHFLKREDADNGHE